MAAVTPLENPDLGLDRPPTRPALTVLAGPTQDPDPQQELFEISGIGRWFVLGSLIGGAGMFLFGLVLTTLTAHSFGAGIGVGAFSALFGGPGFCGSLAAAVATSRQTY